MQAAIEAFDTRLPGLLVMRNVGEHIDSYALDDPKRHHQEVDRRQLQVGSWDGSTFSWLSDESGEELTLNTEDAEEAAFQLYDEVARLACGAAERLIASGGGPGSGRALQLRNDWAIHC